MATSNATDRRERLLALRATLLHDMSHTEGDFPTHGSKTASAPTDMSQRASDESDGELAPCLECETDTLDRIEAAIERIEDGEYGWCENCGEEISESRLNAIPYAAECLRCDSQHKERRRQMDEEAARGLTVGGRISNELGIL